MQNINHAENRRRMTAGELYYAFTPDLIKSRSDCSRLCKQYNALDNGTRRQKVEILHELMKIPEPLPAQLPDPEEDESLFAEFPWIETPLMMDHGWNVRLGANVFLNFNTVLLDTCPITIGARTLVGPNCSFYAATHPLDPAVRNGTKGPEMGAPITIGEDCWFGGNCIVLPGVTIGRGATVGAGSVVTKDVPDMVVVAGNPVRIVRRLEEKKTEDSVESK